MNHPKDRDLDRDLESRLIAQDHRILTLLKLWFYDSRRWDAADPRLPALRLAITMRLFFSPATVAAGAGIVGIVTVVLLFWQIQLLADQNALFRQQLDQFHEDATRRRRTELTRYLFEEHVEEKVSIDPVSGSKRPVVIGPVADARTRTEALLELVALNARQDENLLRLRGARLDFVDVRNATITDVDFRGANVQHAEFVGVRFERCILDALTINRGPMNGCIFDACVISSMAANCEACTAADSLVISFGDEVPSFSEARNVLVAKPASPPTEDALKPFRAAVPARHTRFVERWFTEYGWKMLASR